MFLHNKMFNNYLSNLFNNNNLTRFNPFNNKSIIYIQIKINLKVIVMVINIIIIFQINNIIFKIFKLKIKNTFLNIQNKKYFK